MIRLMPPSVAQRARSPLTPRSAALRSRVGGQMPRRLRPSTHGYQTGITTERDASRHSYARDARQVRAITDAQLAELEHSPRILNLTWPRSARCPASCETDSLMSLARWRVIPPARAVGNGGLWPGTS